MMLNEKQKDALFKIVIFAVIQILCYNLFLIISAISGHFTWTVEQLTASLAGTVIQILNIVFIVNGVILFLYVVVFLLLLLKS